MEAIKIDNNTKNYTQNTNSLTDNHKNLNKIHDLRNNKVNLKNDEQTFSKNIKFSYIVDQDTGKIRIKVYDFLTGETIQEIPSDKFLEFLIELKKGLDKDVIKKQGILPEGIFIENSV